MQYFGLILIQTWLWSVMGSGQIFGNCWNRMVSVKSGGCPLSCDALASIVAQQLSHKETTASSHENTTWHNFAKHLDCAQCDIWSPQKHIFSTKYQAFPCKEPPIPIHSPMRFMTGKGSAPSFRRNSRFKATRSTQRLLVLKNLTPWPKKMDRVGRSIPSRKPCSEGAMMKRHETWWNMMKQ